jgi:hypothetical protein
MIVEVVDFSKLYIFIDETIDTYSSVRDVEDIPLDYRAVYL